MQGQQHFGLTLPAKARQPHYLALAGMKSGTGQRQDRRAGTGRPPPPGHPGGTAHGGDKAGGIEPLCRAFGHDAAIFHHHDPVRRFQHLMQDMRNQDDRPARADKAPDMRQKLRRKPGIER